MSDYSEEFKKISGQFYIDIIEKHYFEPTYELAQYMDIRDHNEISLLTRTLYPDIKVVIKREVMSPIRDSIEGYE